MSDLDFIEEIRIAAYWRKQLGEMEYVTRDPDDLRRWYHALELRGPDEVRSYIEERGGRHPDGRITGIVTKAPHPPREVVEVWLRSHEKFDSKPIWFAAAAAMLAMLLFVGNVAGCMNLKDRGRLLNNPPQPPTVPAQPLNGSPQPLSTPPGNFPAPASQASPRAGSNTPGSQGQQQQ